MATTITTSVEERLSTLETEVTQLKNRLETDPRPSTLPWWEKIFGTFAGSEEYNEAMRLGREYRQSLRPGDDTSHEEAA